MKEGCELGVCPRGVVLPNSEPAVAGVDWPKGAGDAPKAAPVLKLNPLPPLLAAGIPNVGVEAAAPKLGVAVEAAPKFPKEADEAPARPFTALLSPEHSMQSDQSAGVLHCRDSLIQVSCDMQPQHNTSCLFEKVCWGYAPNAGVDEAPNPPEKLPKLPG